MESIIRDETILIRRVWQWCVETSSVLSTLSLSLRTNQTQTTSKIFNRVLLIDTSTYLEIFCEIITCFEGIVHLTLFLEAFSNAFI